MLGKTKGRQTKETGSGRNKENTEQEENLSKKRKEGTTGKRKGKKKKD